MATNGKANGFAAAYSSRVTVESKLYPGVKFVIRGLSLARRVQFESAVAGKNREYMRLLRGYFEERDKIQKDDEQGQRKLLERIDELNAFSAEHLEPATIRTYLERI